ncbi:MAG: glycosyltransferase family 25 protein [Pseudomonadota bacterium]
MAELTVLLINLDSSPDRLKAAETALAAQATACMRIPAVDGRHTPVEDVPTYDAAATLRYFGRALNGGEVGAFQSHLRALSTFLDSGAPYGLILEDDMDPDAQAMAFVSGILAWQKARWQNDWHVVNLGAKRQKLTSPLAVLEAGGTSIDILRGHYFPMLATALLWTRSGAEAFLAQHTRIDCPWDHALRRWLTQSDMGLTVSPPLFLTTGATSQIDTARAARGTEGRSHLYRWRRMKRNWGDRLKAFRHKARHRNRRP